MNTLIFLFYAWFWSNYNICLEAKGQYTTFIKAVEASFTVGVEKMKQDVSGYDGYCTKPYFKDGGRICVQLPKKTQETK